MGLLLLGMLASATAGLGGEAPRESVEALRRYISRRAYKTLLARANRGGGKSAADIFLETASQVSWRPGEACSDRGSRIAAAGV